MKLRHAAPVALLVAVALASVAAAGPNPCCVAGKQRVALTTMVLPTGKAVLAPARVGPLRRDTGTFSGDWSLNPDRTVMRDGQKVGIYTSTWTFTGKRGTLVLRERNEWVDTRDANTPPWVATGTWKVIRGTGRYAGVTGGGRSAHAGLGRTWYARYDGVLRADPAEQEPEPAAP